MAAEGPALQICAQDPGSGQLPKLPVQELPELELPELHSEPVQPDSIEIIDTVLSTALVTYAWVPFGVI
ncbi:hypothetical protein R3Q06_33940, partial [Rhodococcus erythropolis]|uniref:hypothetical protein n=1 Tax=Rhodococcus erythropolis TaxID=1833 RepID=UPI0029493F36